MDGDARDLLEPALALFVELVDAPGDAGLADRLVEFERLGQRPAVLEGMEPAWRHPRRGRHLGPVPPHPIERGDGRGRHGPRRRSRAQDARPPGTEDPLVGAGGEHVAAERRDRLVFHAEAVHAVHAEDRPVLLGAAAIRRGHRLGEAGDGRADACPRVDPGHRHHARRGADLPRESLRHLVGVGLARLFIERDAAHGSASPRGTRAGTGTPVRAAACASDMCVAAG